ncbi:MAG: FAD-dependent oxidoreductase, partial [Bacteroides sp.]|nr:FAD-dependent oxidoreductase [Bacteroides sp.]
MIKFDYIVVGGGLSGLYTAFLLSKKGKVALLAKTSLLESNSYQAQGGLAAVTDDEDT